MWDKINDAKAGDPRDPYAKTPAGHKDGKQQPDGSTPCQSRPDEVCVDQGHSYDRFTPETLQRGKAVSAKFGELLRDLPLFQGTSRGVQLPRDFPFRSPHEDLHRPGAHDNDGSPADKEKDYVMLPDNSQQKNTVIKHFISHGYLTSFYRAKRADTL